VKKLIQPFRSGSLAPTRSRNTGFCRGRECRAPHKLGPAPYPAVRGAGAHWSGLGRWV